MKKIIAAIAIVLAIMLILGIEWNSVYFDYLMDLLSSLFMFM